MKRGGSSAEDLKVGVRSKVRRWCLPPIDSPVTQRSAHATLEDVGDNKEVERIMQRAKLPSPDRFEQGVVKEEIIRRAAQVERQKHR